MDPLLFGCRLSPTEQNRPQFTDGQPWRLISGFDQCSDSLQKRLHSSLIEIGVHRLHEGFQVLLYQPGDRLGFFLDLLLRLLSDLS